MVKSKEQLLDYIENSVLVYSSINDYGKQTFADGDDYSDCASSIYSISGNM